MVRIDTVVLDYGGVVADQYCEPYQTQIANALGVGHREARRMISETSEQGKAYRLGELDVEEFWNVVKGICRCDFDYKTLQGFWDRTYILNNAIVELLRYLKNNKGVQTGVVSNDGPARWEQIRTANAIDEFASISLVSYQVGVLKPDPAFFDAMLARCRRKERQERVLYVDDRETHVDAAADLGIQTHLFLNAGDLMLFLAEQELVKFVP